MIDLLGLVKQVKGRNGAYLEKQKLRLVPMRDSHAKLIFLWYLVICHRRFLGGC